MTGKHEQARRIKQFYGQLFRHGIILGCCETDPTYPLRGVLGKTETHYATITEPREVGGLMCAIYSYGPFVMRRALQLHMYTFVCPGELRYAGWSEIDWDRAVWKIPAEKMKMKRIHWVPLSRQSVEVLRAIGKYTGGGRYIFPSTRVRDGSRPMSEAGELVTFRRIGYTTEGICPHGFRGMASTLLHENGWPSDYIEKQLTHEVRNTVAQAYNHAQHLEKRTEMMQWWADYLDKLRDTA